MTPEQFYSESKWPEMKDKFDKSAFEFSHDDLCQFANDYAQQEIQAYRDNLKNAIAGRDLNYFEILELIDTVTPT